LYNRNAKRIKCVKQAVIAACKKSSCDNKSDFFQNCHRENKGKLKPDTVIKSRFGDSDSTFRTEPFSNFGEEDGRINYQQMKRVIL
jgi:hypothetical protein